MALKFDIKSTQDCGTLKYTNCSTYCSPDNYIVDNILVASITRNIRFLGDFLQVTTDILTTTEIDTIEWVVNGGNTINSTNIPTNTGIIAIQEVLPGVITGVNEVTLTVTDIDGNVSTLNFAFNTVITNNQFTLEWLAIPELSVTTGNTLEVGYSDASILVNTTQDNIVFEPDGSTDLGAVLNFTYTTGTYNLLFSFDETEDNTNVSLNAYISIQEDTTDCNSQLTTTDILSVALVATSPSNMSYTTDISNLFFQNNFDVTTTMFGIASDTFESGIWTFQTIVTKVTNTGTFIFAQTIKVVLFCKEQCSFNAYVATYAEEELDCCTSCKEEKEKKIILMSTYIDAIKNASACGELTKITKFINLLQRLLSNKNCNC
jgi:hypothetical protein